MTAQYGVIVFQGVSGRRYSKQMYADDTAGHMIKIDAGGGALNGDTWWMPPEDVSMQDFCLAAATAQTQTQIMRDNAATGDMLLNSLHLASVTNRPFCNIGFRRGVKAAFLQVA